MAINANGGRPSSFVVVGPAALAAKAQTAFPSVVRWAVDASAVPLNTDVPTVLLPTVEDISTLFPILARSEGLIVAAMLGDPVFSELTLVGEVVGLQVVHVADGSTVTVFALRRRRRIPAVPAVPAVPAAPAAAVMAEVKAIRDKQEVVLRALEMPWEGSQQESSQKPSVLFIVDRHDWCFARTAAQAKRYLSDEFDIQILTLSEVCVGPKRSCDVLVCFSRNQVQKARLAVDAHALVLGMFEDFTTGLEELEADAIAITNGSFLGRLPQSRRLPPVHIVEAGVDCTRFRPTPLPPQLVAGWCGNSAAGVEEDHKGLSIVQAACDAAGIPLKVLDVASGTDVPHEQMPAFYDQISVLLCASKSEGAPNPVLEAAACGRLVISTNVGIVSRVIESGVSGLIVSRTLEAFTGALWALTMINLQGMGAAARRAVERHDWSIKIEAWRKCLREVAELAKVRRSAWIPTPDLPELQSAQVRGSSSSTKPRVLLTCDVPGWAFDVNLKDLAEYLGGDFDFEFWYAIRNRPLDCRPFDKVYVPYHRWSQLRTLDYTKAYGALRSRWFKPEEPRPAAAPEAELVNRFRAFHVVTQDNLKELADRCPRVEYLTNPVNMRRFPRATRTREIVASWTGNARHINAAGVDVKGFYNIVQPACLTADVPLVFAEYHTNRLPPSEMPEFFQQGNVTICTSLYEGASNSVLEGMAAGHALITTDVGNHQEMRRSQIKHFGQTGIVLVERNVRSVVEVLEQLKAEPDRVVEMGRVNRAEIEARWSWDVWAPKYKEFLGR